MKRALICAMVLFAAAPVWADATVFVGANLTPTNRAVRGGALGAGLLIIGFEGEYAFTPDDPEAAAPSLVTGSGNVLLQTPFAVLGLQPYVTTGAGLYREKLGTHQDTSFALHGRRREGVAGRSAAASGRLPRVQARKRRAELSRAPHRLRTESEILIGPPVLSPGAPHG